MTIKKYTITVYLIFPIILFYTGPAFGLEALSEDQLDVVTGQAGITILLTSMLIQHDQAELKFNDTVGGAVSFNDISLDFEISTKSNGITIDIVENSGYETLQLKMSDMGTDLDFTADDVLFNGNSIGNIEIDTLQVPELELNLYAYNGSGIDAELAFQLEVDRLEYTYDVESSIDPESSLTLTGIMAAEYFDGDALPSFTSTTGTGVSIDTSTWDAQGSFTLGDTNPVNSFFIDIENDSSPYMEHRFNIDSNGNYNLDSDGRIGTAVGGSEPWIANPRQDDAFIYAGGNISGSFRIEEVQYNDESTGPVAIDGVSGSVYIEAPGRGYGNSWDLPYYNNDN